MAAVPKRRHSKGRRDRKRSHLALTATNITKCSNCGAASLSHHVCKNCGYYGAAKVKNIS